MTDACYYIYMLNKINRVNTETFNDVMEKGRVAHSDNFYIKSLSADSDRRFSIAVPKKIVKSAVRRNLFKRKVKSILKEVMGDFPTGDYIIFFKSGALVLDQENIKSEILKLASLSKAY